MKNKYHLEHYTPGPWLVIRHDAEHAIISNVTGRAWPAIDHYVGKVRANNAPLIIAAPDLADMLQKVRALVLSSDQNESGTVTITLTPDLCAEIDVLFSYLENGGLKNV
jgi:hypothetical protein